jgi:hypothetical protein
MYLAENIRYFLRDHPEIYVANIFHILDRLDAYNNLLELTKQVNVDNQTKATNEYNMSLAAYNQLRLEYEEKYAEYEKRELIPYLLNQRELLVLHPEPKPPNIPLLINPPRITIESMPGWRPEYADIETYKQTLLYLNRIISALDNKSKFKDMIRIKIPPEYLEIFDLLKNCGYKVSIKLKIIPEYHHYSEGEGYNHREYTEIVDEEHYKIKIKI